MDAAAYIVEVVENYLLYYMGEYGEEEDEIEKEFEELSDFIEDDDIEDWQLMDYDPIGNLSMGMGNADDAKQRRRNERYR